MENILQANAIAPNELAEHCANHVSVITFSFLRSEKLCLRTVHSFERKKWRKERTNFVSYLIQIRWEFIKIQHTNFSVHNEQWYDFFFSRNRCTANTAIEHLWLQIIHFPSSSSSGFEILMMQRKYQTREIRTFWKADAYTHTNRYTHLFALNLVALNVVVHIEM